MSLHRNRALAALAVVVALSGCATRLSGPLHQAEGPPWIAQGAHNTVPAIDVAHRLLLIGDAGYYLENDPTLLAIDHWATEVDSSSVLFLGDNIYDEGLTDDDREHGELILGHQLEATLARKIFIPGNHDWGLLPKNQNAKAIRNQQAFVDEWPLGNAEFIPKEGCMGPTTRILLPATESHAAVVFIALDPTPWINPRLREDCPVPQTQDELLSALEAQLEVHKNDFVVVASHYPMLTAGPHGGLTYGFLTDLLITPIGWVLGGLGNTYEPDYADWIAHMEVSMRKNPPAIYAAGHDHNLQILKSGDVAGVYLVSGAGAQERVSTVTDIAETIFAHAAPGFMVVDYGYDGERETVIIRVVEAGKAEPVFETERPVLH